MTCFSSYLSKRFIANLEQIYLTCTLKHVSHDDIFLQQTDGKQEFHLKGFSLVPDYVWEETIPPVTRNPLDFYKSHESCETAILRISQGYILI